MIMLTFPLRRTIRRLRLPAMALALVSAFGNPSIAVPNWSTYEGADAGRIPAEARKFFMTEGMTVVSIAVDRDSMRYTLSSPQYEVAKGAGNPNPYYTSDDVFVTIQLFDRPDQADTYFKRLARENFTCEGWKNTPNVICQRVDLGGNVAGLMVIHPPENYQAGPAGVEDAYLIALHDANNTIIELHGDIHSNWSNSDTVTKRMASRLAGLGPTQVLNQARPTAEPVAQAPVVAQSAAARRVADTAATQWQKIPSRNQAEKDIIGKNAFVIARGSDGLLVCSVNSGAKEKFNRTPGAVPPPRLLDDKSLVGRALATLDLAQADVSGLLEGLSMPEANIPAAIRERSYMLWEPNHIQDYLYGAQLNYAPEPAAGLQKTGWRPGASLSQFISSEHGSCRGTINGGGDFINFVAPPEGQARLIPIAASPAATQTVTVELPGTTITMPASTVAAIDLAPNGIAALAVLSGSAQITELATGARRSVGAGQFAVSAPGLGLSTVLAVSAAANQNLTKAQRGPGAAPPAPAPPPGATLAGSIFDIQTARDVAFGQPVGVADTFPTDNNPIFVWFRHKGIAAGSHIVAVWYYLETAQPLEIGRGDIAVQPPSDWGQFSYSLADGKKWPQGRYRVDLLVEGRLAGNASFRVAPSPQAAPSAPMTYSDSVAGYSLTMPAQWVKDDSAAPGILRLLNPDRTVGLELQSIQSDGRIADRALFAQVEGSFRQDADYSIESSGPEFVAALNRTAYRMMLRAKAEDQLRSVLLVPRGPSGFNRAFYLVKIVGGPAWREEIGQAMGQFIAGFHAN